MSEHWEGTVRVESVTRDVPDAPGWVAFEIVLRPVDKRGRVNGGHADLTTVHVGGPVDQVDMTGLEVGIKCVWTFDAGPTPTHYSTVHPL